MGQGLEGRIEKSRQPTVDSCADVSKVVILNRLPNKCKDSTADYEGPEEGVDAKDGVNVEPRPGKGEGRQKADVLTKEKYLNLNPLLVCFATVNYQISKKRNVI